MLVRVQVPPEVQNQKIILCNCLKSNHIKAKNLEVKTSKLLLSPQIVAGCGVLGYIEVDFYGVYKRKKQLKILI